MALSFSAFLRVHLGACARFATGLAAVGLLSSVPASAPAQSLPGLVGDDQSTVVPAGDTLVDLAYRHRVGFEPLVRLNPGVKVWIPEAGTELRLPTRAVLPDARPVGLVVNLPEMRLFDFTAGAMPRLFAIATGDSADPSPVGTFRIGEKRIDPAWRVPGSIRRERPELPAVVAPGPDNPLGSRWMTLGSTSYGLHGTNLPWSIGRPATHGCIRLYEEEVRELFDRVPSGTLVRIVYQTVKIGQHDGGIFVEAHPDLYARGEDRHALLSQRLAELGLLAHIDLGLALQIVDEAQGVPVRIGTLRGQVPS